MSRHTVQNGNNMPVQAPLIPDPFVPYHCPGNTTLNVVCRAPDGVLERYLAPTPFEPVSDLFVAYVSDFSQCDKVPFMDGGVIVPVTFEGQAGGNFLFEYEDHDAAIAAGRDLWGYPKKYGALSLDVDGDRVEAVITRQGTDLMRLTCNLSKPVDVPAVTVTPHLNLHVQPGPDGTVLSRRVIVRDTSPDFVKRLERSGVATVELASLPAHPLDELGPTKVLGGVLVIGDFHATEANGWGRTIAEVT